MGKKITIYAILLLIAFVSAGCGKEPVIDAPENIEPRSEETSHDFEEAISQLEAELMFAWMAAHENNPGNLLRHASRVLDHADRISHYFSPDRPNKYRKSANWSSKMDTIYDLAYELSEASKQKDHVQAKRKTNEIRTFLRSLRNENNISAYQDELLVFQGAVERIFSAPDKETAVKLLPEAKIALASLKGYPQNKDQARIMSEIEKEIGRIDKLDGLDYRQAKEKLQSLFYDLLVY